MKFEDIAKTFTKKELQDSEVELTGEIPFDTVAPYREQALKNITAEAEMPGFRKGHVPTDMVLKKVGEMAILEEAVEILMRDFYPELVDVLKLDVVGRPDIRITKLTPGAPVEITIKTPLYPVVELPKHWRDVSKDIAIETVSDILDSEVDEALQSIRRAHAKATSPESPENTPTSEVKSEDLPALDDAFAQSLGKFADLAELKTKLRENLKLEKEQQTKDKRRGMIVEKLLEQTKVAIPAVFVESELEKIINQLKEDITRFGLTFEQYLKKTNKTEDAVRDEFRDQAGKRAKLQLALNKLADQEKVEADKETVEQEMKHALEHFPDARPELVKIHIETVLRNEKVLQMLEGGSETKIN